MPMATVGMALWLCCMDLQPSGATSFSTGPTVAVRHTCWPYSCLDGTSPTNRDNLKLTLGDQSCSDNGNDTDKVLATF